MFNDGDWRMSRPRFAPDLLDQGIASTQRQLKLWYDTGVTPVEVSARKSNVIGAFKVALTTTDGMAGSLLAAVNRGYDVSWLDELPGQGQCAERPSRSTPPSRNTSSPRPW